MTPSYTGDDSRLVAAAYAALAALSILLYLTAPIDGAFYWSEAPRNALNGAFLLDLFKELPFSDPIGWAEQYYYQYPALTILFYPPLLHVVLAGAFAIGGISQSIAVGTVSLFTLLLMAGTFAFARRMLPVTGAAGAALLIGSAPELALWGRQVMLEIPALAFAVWGLVFLSRFLDERKTLQLAAAMFLGICAVYTKQTFIFLVPCYALMLLRYQWREVLLKRRNLSILLLSAAALVPLVILQLKFASFNLTSVSNRPDIGIDRWSATSWLWYLVHTPQCIGWPVTAAAALLPLALVKSGFSNNRTLSVLLVSTFAAWLFFTLIALKETRHGIPIYFGLSLIAIYTIHQIVGQRTANIVTFVIVALTLSRTMLYSPVPALTGYREAAQFVVEKSSAPGRVMFVGNRDGHFIFNMRTLDPTRSWTVVRADKLLLNIKIMPEFGYGARDLGEAEIAEMLNRYGIQWIVAVDEFWLHIPVMRKLDGVLKGTGFERVAEIPIHSNAPHKDKRLIVYRNRVEFKKAPEDYKINLGAIPHSVDPRSTRVP